MVICFFTEFNFTLFRKIMKSAEEMRDFEEGH